MKPSLKFAALAAVIALAGLTAFLFSSPASTQSSRRTSTTTPVDSQLREGDLVLRMGRGIWSNVFRDTSPHDRRYSHVGILVASESGGAGFNVVHAAADDLTGVGRVRSEPLVSFLEDAETWGIYRNDRLPPAQIASSVGAFLGRPFDASFNLDDDTSIYCTELVYLCFNKLCGPGTIATEIHNGRKIVALENCYAPAAGWKLVVSKAGPDGTSK